MVLPVLLHTTGSNSCTTSLHDPAAPLRDPSAASRLSSSGTPSGPRPEASVAGAVAGAVLSLCTSSLTGSTTRSSGQVVRQASCKAAARGSGGAVGGAAAGGVGVTHDATARVENVNGGGCRAAAAVSVSAVYSMTTDSKGSVLPRGAADPGAGGEEGDAVVAPGDDVMGSAPLLRACPLVLPTPSPTDLHPHSLHISLSCRRQQQQQGRHQGEKEALGGRTEGEAGAEAWAGAGAGSGSGTACADKSTVDGDSKEALRVSRVSKGVS